MGEARDAFGEDFIYPDGVLVAAAWGFWSRLSRRRVAYDVLEVQQGDVAGRLGHRLNAQLDTPDLDPATGRVDQQRADLDRGEIIGPGASKMLPSM